MVSKVDLQGPWGHLSLSFLLLSPYMETLSGFQVCNLM